MKKITTTILLCAGILLLLTGCQKDPRTPETSGNSLRLRATTAVGTRTAYSGEMVGQFERIDWTTGDEIIIWSDNATVRPDGQPYFAGNDKLALYSLGTISTSGEKSIALLDDPEANGLQYPEGDPGSKLWGVYPASVLTASPSGNAIPFAIAETQALAPNDSTQVPNDYVPAMSQAVMLAYVSGAKASKLVDLPFKPAFTAFEFDIKGQDMVHPLTITAVEMVSEGDNSTALSGSFTATFDDATEAWTYTLGEETQKSVKVTFPGNGITIDNETNAIFDIFALPQELTGIKVIFYTNEGTKALKLTTVNDDPTQRTYLTFAPTKKHKFNGLILPTGWYFSYITLDLKVLEWEAVDITGSSGEFPQVTQFSVTGNNVKNGDTDLHLGGPITDDNRKKDPYRQQWYFMPGDTVTVFFKVMLPSGGTWEVEPVGGRDGEDVPADLSNFTITNLLDTENPTALSGPVKASGSTDVKLQIVCSQETVTGEHSFYFHTYVYSQDGTKFNVDSETQLYDRGRGFHTFIVCDSYPTPSNN